MSKETQVEKIGKKTSVKTALTITIFLFGNVGSCLRMFCILLYAYDLSENNHQWN